MFLHIRYIDKCRAQISLVKAFLYVFYLVGVIGLMWEMSRPLFLKLTPVALLLSFFVLGIFYQHTFKLKTYVTFLLIYVLSFVIEAIGVHSGAIFGNYHYGSGLGIKLFDTPVMIGINWLMLIYVTASVVDKLKLSTSLSILLASIGMVIYDMVLEQMASVMDMWYWQNNHIPVQNYISWFVISVVFQTILKMMQVRTDNKLAVTVFVCQFLFFLGLLGLNSLKI